MNNPIIFSSDADVLQSNLIVFKNNTCLWIDYDSEMFNVYVFDLLTDVESWIDLNDINSSCDANYTNELKTDDYIHFTSDVCWYYGAINLDGYPTTYSETEFLKLINETKS